MARPKRLPVSDPGKIKEYLLRHGIDPFEEKLKMYRERIPVPVGVDPEILRPMMQRWDLVQDENGKQWLQPTYRDRQDSMSECCKYVYPVLRSSETKDEKDFKITLVMKSYLPNEQPVKTTVVDVTPKEIDNGDRTTLPLRS